MVLLLTCLNNKISVKSYMISSKFVAKKQKFCPIFVSHIVLKYYAHALLCPSQSFTKLY